VELAPDLIVASRCVLTMAHGHREPGCVAVRDGRIVAVGATEDVAELRGPDTEVIDVGDRPLMPGFIDVHAHYEVAARVLSATVDCRAPECATVADVQDALRSRLDRATDGWLVGQANLFFDQKLAELRLPTREELDQVSTDVAIALRAGGHITVLNSRGLELAGIDADYVAPTHSVTGLPIVERDSDGRPTGVVKEMDNLLPLPGTDSASLRDALRDGAHRLFTRYGVTTVGEISETWDGIRQMDALHARDELPIRVAVYLWTPGTTSLDRACSWRDEFAKTSSDERLRIQGVKMFADGGYSAASAAVKRPYLSDPCSCGSIALSPEQIAEALQRTAESGLQLAIHANGDRAQEEVCRAIVEAGGSPTAARLRTRIEHAGNFLPEYDETTGWWRKAGIVPVPQPVFLYTFGDFFPSYLGDYGARGRFPFRRLIDDGWRLSGSSDVWIGSERPATNPMFSVWCCVKRESFRGEILDADQATSIDDALRMHTLDAAAVLGEESSRGSLEVGKLADMIVLDRDPRRVEVDQLPQIRVERVFLGGRTVHVA
jgi:predicted amidohydrolase YtcJ